MDLEYIKETARKERARDLQPLSSDFYERVREYTISLEEEMRKNGRPRSLEYKMFEDELTSIISDTETIFMKRTGKVIERATSNAFSTSGSGLLKKDEEKLLPEEKILYQAVFKAIEEARKSLIEKIVDTDHPTLPAQKQKKEPAEINDKSPDYERKEKEESDKNRKITDPSKTVINNEYILVRILIDLPEFMGDDKRNYRIRSQDVVLLPAANAKLLIKRNIALPISGNCGV